MNQYTKKIKCAMDDCNNRSIGKDCEYCEKCLRGIQHRMRLLENSEKKEPSIPRGRAPDMIRTARLGKT